MTEALTESRRAFGVPDDVFEAAIEAHATAQRAGSCPDHCVAMACEVVQQASEQRFIKMLEPIRAALECAERMADTQGSDTQYEIIAGGLLKLLKVEHQLTKE